MQTKKKRLPIWFWKELQGCMMNEEWWTVLFGARRVENQGEIHAAGLQGKKPAAMFTKIHARTWRR